MTEHRTVRRRENAYNRIRGRFPAWSGESLRVVTSYLCVDTLEVIAARLEETPYVDKEDK